MGEIISLIVCTRNRAFDLQETLLSLAQVDRPVDKLIEVVVIDNGSTDNTQSMLSSLDLKGLNLRTVIEPIAGVARARNAGIVNSVGDPLIFIDDDLRFPKDWLTALLSEFTDGVDALAGSIRVAPHLVRDWMTPKHKEFLGSTEMYEKNGDVGLHGGTMGFRRHIFQVVPEFDVELGVGALGSNEELLFADQLVRAGFKIGDYSKCPAEHHCSISLIERDSLVKRALNMGRSSAYISFHWKHDEADADRGRELRIWLGYLRRKLKANRKTLGGIEPFEIDYHYGRGYRAQLKIESKRPRNYEKYGLRKIQSP